MNDYDTQKRAALIHELERKQRNSAIEYEAAIAKHRLFQAQMNLVTRLYIDAITAPMRALAEEIRMADRRQTKPRSDR